MSSPSAIVKLVAPRIPGMLKTALWHSLNMTETSDKWDLRTALIITTLRGIMTSSNSTVTQQQTFGLKDNGVKGPMWISRVELPVPDEDDLRQLLFKVVDELNLNSASYTKPASHNVTAEWTGYRGSVAKDTPEPPGLTEETKYRALMDDVKSDVTVLFFHGGAYYLMDPVSHRPTSLKLARKTKGRVLSVRYRLAPQNPFPAALLDAIYSYLYLLYPPAGAFHTAVKPEHIVFAGDSAGGNLALVLLRFLLYLHQTSPAGTMPNVTYNGRTVELPLPAGCATNSPWLDLTRNMPSMTRNLRYDYLPTFDSRMFAATPSLASGARKQRDIPRVTPPCAAWPTTPPRADIFCDGEMLCHPLVSPLSTSTADWTGSPPIFVCQGEELLADEGRCVVRRAAQAGVPVIWEGFEAMPHCFAMLLEGNETSRRCFRGWADAIKDFVSGAEIKPRGTWVKALGSGEDEVDITAPDFVAVTDEESWSIMKREMERRCKEFADIRKDLTDKETSSRL